MIPCRHELCVCIKESLSYTSLSINNRWAKNYFIPDSLPKKALDDDSELSDEENESEDEDQKEKGSEYKEKEENDDKDERNREEEEKVTLFCKILIYL